MNIAERGWDPQYLARWRGRIDALAARASRDPVEESRRLHEGARRAALVAEHGSEYADLLEHARRPLVLDLSAEIPQPHAKRHSPSRQPRRRSGSLRASAGARLRRIRQTRRAAVLAYDRRRPRGFVASANGDGTFSVSDRHGRPIPNVSLTASGGLVEYVAAQLDPYTPGELTARSVLRFGDLVVGFARELARK